MWQQTYCTLDASTQTSARPQFHFLETNMSKVIASRLSLVPNKSLTSLSRTTIGWAAAAAAVMNVERKTCKHNEGLPRPWTQNLPTQLGFGDKTKTTWLLQDKVLTDPAVWILFTDLFFWLSSSFFKSIPQVWWWSTTPPHGVDQFLLQHANQASSP